MPLMLLVLLLAFLSFGIPDNTVKCRVIYVYDGDTFKCRRENGKEVRVRLIGIDTPETSENRRAFLQAEKLGSIEKVIEFGTMAKEYVEDVLYTSDVVYLEFDVQRTDKYGRILAYVWLPNGEMLNELLLREGYAMLLTIPPNVKYVERFKTAQEHARQNGRGLWEEEIPEEEYKCGEKRYCSEMSSCEEAMFYYKNCGLRHLDGDGDGIPCENLCSSGLSGIMGGNSFLKVLVGVLFTIGIVGWVATGYSRLRRKKEPINKAVKLIEDDKVYKLKGNTYPLRKELKKYGAKWIAQEKVWEIEGKKLKLFLLANVHKIKSVKIKDGEVIVVR